jgi:hypothetical protein
MEKNFSNDFIVYIVDDDPTCYNEAIKSIDACTILVRNN